VGSRAASGSVGRFRQRLIRAPAPPFRDRHSRNGDRVAGGARLRAGCARHAPADRRLTRLLEGPFLTLVRDGRAIFLQLEAALWEDRRVFDRVVITTPPITWRLDRDTAGGGVVLQDQHGGQLRHGDVRQPLPIAIDLGPASRVEDDAVYYVHATLTAATVDEQDIERAGQAIFGGEQASTGFVGLGRFVFRTLLRMGKYLESATAEVTSRRVAGREIRTGGF
jgi:hypothetical protein